MRQAFPGYYRPSQEQFQSLWEQAIVVPDASVLLNVYGYSTETREELMSLLERLEARLWIPHQFALEYQRNRAKAILEQVRNYRSVESALRRTLDQEFKSRRKHPFIDKKQLRNFERTCDDLNKGLRDHEALLKDDCYFARITGFFDGKVGAPYPGKALNSLYADGKNRYAAQIPPGYNDSDKGEPDCFGDFIGWRQIMDFAKADSRPVILLTDDAKDDWWQIVSERTIGPRPELVAEFLRETEQAFYMYSLDGFMTWASSILGQTVKQEAIREIKEQREAQALAASDSKPSIQAGVALNLKSVPSEQPDAKSVPAPDEVGNEDKATSL
jgi:hypothetical protein